MSCILRIGGTSLDIGALLSSCSLTPVAQWRRGEVRTVGRKVRSTSGANFLASDVDFDAFDIQVADAAAFLREHSAQLRRLAAFDGVDSATLDFAVSIDEDTMVRSCTLSPELVRLAADAGLGLEISFYACSSESEEDD
jgi:hypothetical protein